MDDLISRQDAIDAVRAYLSDCCVEDGDYHASGIEYELNDLPSAHPEQRYTKEELKVFRHGISLSLLSKRSSQHWCYDEDMATEIEFLERLYEKVSADMRGEPNG